MDSKNLLKICGSDDYIEIASKDGFALGKILITSQGIDSIQKVFEKKIQEIQQRIHNRIHECVEKEKNETPSKKDPEEQKRLQFIGKHIDLNRFIKVRKGPEKDWKRQAAMIYDRAKQFYGVGEENTIQQQLEEYIREGRWKDRGIEQIEYKYKITLTDQDLEKMIKTINTKITIAHGFITSPWKRHASIRVLYSCSNAEFKEIESLIQKFAKEKEIQKKAQELVDLIQKNRRR